MLFAVGGVATFAASSAPSPSPASSPASSASSAAPKKPAPTQLEERPERFVAKTPRSRGDRDRLEALSLFSAARIREQRQDYAGALRLYQRALRYDPSAVSILRSIVPAAVRLKRPAEAVRYALKLVELDASDPALAMRLAAYLTETGQWDRALAIYERLAAPRAGGADASSSGAAGDRRENAAPNDADAKKTPAAPGSATAKPAEPSADEIVSTIEIGRLYFLLEKPDRAADAFARVLEAMEHPEKYPADSPSGAILRERAKDTYELMGEAFLAAGRWQPAAQCFDRLHRLHPDKPLLGYRTARVELRRGRPEKAFASLREYFDARRSDEGLAPCQTLAETLKALKKESELIPYLERLFAVDSSNGPIGFFLAERYLDAGRLDKAGPLLTKVAERNSTPGVLRRLIEVERRTKQYEPLLKTLGRGVAVTSSLDALTEKNRRLSDDPELVKALVATGRRLTAPAEKQPNAASNDANSDDERARATKEPPISQESLIALGLLTQDAKQYDEAAAFFEAAARAKPDRAMRVFLLWGIGLSAHDESARAAAVFQKAIDRKIGSSPDPSLYYHLAGALELSGRTDAALTAIRKAVELAESEAESEPGNARPEAAPDTKPSAPASPKSPNEKPNGVKPAPPAAPQLKSNGPKPGAPAGNAKPDAPAEAKPEESSSEEHASDKEDDEAEHPDHEAANEVAKYRSRIGWILYHAKRYEEAVKEYKALLAEYDDDHESTEIRELMRDARLALSSLNIFLHDNAGAEEWLEQVLDEFPDDPSAQNDLAYLWAERGRNLERALRMGRSAVRQEPENMAYRDTLGWILFRLGRPQEALVELDKAAANEDDPTVQEHLGDVCRALKQEAKAEAAYRKALAGYLKADEPDKADRIRKQLPPQKPEKSP